MSNIPQKEHKLLRGLSDYVSSCLEELITNKEDLLVKLSKSNCSVFIFGQSFKFHSFQKATINFTEEQWKKLIGISNSKLGEKIKEMKREAEMTKRINDMIAQDPFLSRHNISIAELVEEDRNYYIAKVYLICGGYFLDGTLREIVEQIRYELKDEDVNVRAFCPSCSSKNLRFVESFCLCNECGALSLIEENKVVKQYKKEDKDFWWASALADSQLLKT